MSGVHVGQKRASDTPQLELEVVVSYHVRAGNGKFRSPARAVW